MLPLIPPNPIPGLPVDIPGTKTDLSEIWKYDLLGMVRTAGVQQNAAPPSSQQKQLQWEDADHSGNEMNSRGYFHGPLPVKNRAVIGANDI
jgi:hypothetical protein